MVLILSEGLFSTNYETVSQLAVVCFVRGTQIAAAFCQVCVEGS